MIRTSYLEKEFEALSEECLSDKCTGALKEKMQCECGRLILRNWLKDKIENQFKSKTLYFWTVYLERDEMEGGDLKSFSLKNSKRSLTRYVKKLELLGFRAIGFLDIQLREFRNYPQAMKPEWLCHYHFLVVSNDDINDLRRKLDRAFPKKSKHLRPSNIKIAKRLPFNYGYLIKFDYEMKRKERCFYTGESKSHTRIKGINRQELRSYLSTVHLLETLYLIGMRRCYDSLVEL
jgi:hypothetical protein